MSPSFSNSQSGADAASGLAQQTLSSLDYLFQKALQCHTQGEHDQALDLYKEVLDADSDHAEACFYAALLYSDAGNFAEALPLLERAHDLQPSLPAVTYQLGICQYVLGDNQAAITSFERVLDSDEQHWQAAYNLGLACYAAGLIDQAIEAYGRAAQLHSNDSDIFFNLGLAYKKGGFFDKAEEAYTNAMEIEPDDPGVHYNMGRLYNEMGRKEDALLSLKLAVALRPDYGAALSNLGVLYSSLEMYEEAIVVYEKLVEIGHNSKAAGHILNALQGHTTDTAPIAYIQELYDDFAAHFEKRLVDDLCYDVPSKLVTLLKQQQGERRTYPRMLDLGCGTGLCGQAFLGLATSLTGVDLSAKMIEKAQGKGIYEQLLEDDIISFLESSRSSYDLIVAGDVLIYMGELESVFRLLPKCLAPHGRVIFSTEPFGGNGYTLMPSGRYAHSTSYVTILAKENNLDVLAVESTNLRKEKGKWIVGQIYVLGHAGEAI